MLKNNPLRLPAFHFDADPDPAFLFDADADAASLNDVDPQHSFLEPGSGLYPDP